MYNVFNPPQTKFAVHPNLFLRRNLLSNSEHIYLIVFTYCLCPVQSFNLDFRHPKKINKVSNTQRISVRI